MNTKKILACAAVAAVALAGVFHVTRAHAQNTLPTYITKTASGSLQSAATSVVWFAAQPYQQPRLVSLLATSDLATAQCAIYQGNTAQLISQSNTTAGVLTQVAVPATNGFTIGDYILIETAAGLWTNGQITAFGAATNIICGNKLIATVPGDQVYDLGQPNAYIAQLPVIVSFATPVNYQGEALAIGNRGRPMLVILNGTSASKIVGATIRDE